MTGGPSGTDRARATLAFLRRHITSGEWPVNSRIPTEPELMALVGVGKSTIREAVRSLASLGMLETLPGRGTFVRSRTPVSAVLSQYFADFELADLLVFRRAIEVEAARQAAMHRTDAHLDALTGAHANDTLPDVDYPATPPARAGRTPGQFHAVLFDAAGNPLLSNMYAGVMARVRGAMAQGEVSYIGSEAERRDEHGEILAAITAGDVTAAARAMSAHADHDLGLSAGDPSPTA